LLKIYVRNGVIARIETDDGEEPQYRACAKGRAWRQRVYASDRLKYPMRRVGERGSGEFERISWDEALDTVASEIKRVKKTYGPSAVLFSCSGGDLGWLHTPGLADRLLVRAGGYSGVYGGISAQGMSFSSMVTYGHTLTTSTAREDLLNSHLIILWGWDPASSRTYGHTHWYLSQAKEAGAKIIAVDPRYTDSVVTFAHQWVPIRPGTDTAMLIAMAFVMITENLLDQAFLDKYTVGFDKFKDYVLGTEDNVPKTPAWAEVITGVPTVTIASLAREYATTKPAALMEGLAPGRSAYGEQFHRATVTLAAMTGNIGIPGANAPGVGGLMSPLRLGPQVSSRMKGGDNPVDREAPPRKESVSSKSRGSKGYEGVAGAEFYSSSTSSARVQRIHLADAILKGRRGGYPADYKLLYLVANNYVTQYANSNKIAQALKTLDFIVVHEQVMSPTARYADIVLPTNTFLERNDITTGGAGPFYGYMNKVIDSVGESKSHFEICVELAARLGISDYSDKTEEEWIREVVNNCKDIPDYDTFKKQGVHKVKFSKPFVAFEEQISDSVNHPFGTPSGKIEICSQMISNRNDPEIPPIPKYIEAWESRNDPLSKKYPLQLVTPHPKRRAHSQFENTTWLRELVPQALSINTADAKARGIKDGNMVRVFNDRGEMIIPAMVTERIMPGVVSIPEGAWYDPNENGIDCGGCVNIFTKDVVSSGGAFCSNTALVQVAKL